MVGKKTLWTFSVSLLASLFLSSAAVDAGYVTLTARQLSTLMETETDGARFSGLNNTGIQEHPNSYTFGGAIGEFQNPRSSGFVRIGGGILNGDHGTWSDDTFMLRVRTGRREDDIYRVAAYVKTGDGSVYKGDYVEIGPHKDWEHAVVDLTGATGLNEVTEVGFVVKADFFNGRDSRHPSSPDFFQVEAAPIPEPATLSLFGLGALGALVLRRRRRQKS